MEQKEFHVRQDQNHMATTFEFWVRCQTNEVEHAEAVLTRAHQLVDQLEEQLSEFRETGPVYLLNHSVPGTEISMPDSTLALLQKSLELAAQTGKAFHPLAKGNPSGNISISAKEKTASRAHEETQLSFGAIGKGYALDRVSELLSTAGFKNYLLSAGGSSIVMAGFAADQTAWNFAWSWKKNTAGDSLGIKFSHQTGKKIALGISGTHEQGNHLLDVRDLCTGSNPSQFHNKKALKSAFVAHESATTADALSTALFVTGWMDSGLFSPENGLIAAAVIDAEEVPHWTKGFQKLWGSIGTRALMFLLALQFFLPALAHAEAADEAINLGALDTHVFTPYVLERQNYWVLLPIILLAITLLHLRRDRRKTPRKY
jgi:thiamine biosynthesis lipoprotein ApbE